MKREAKTRSKGMSPAQFAKSECPHLVDGHCLSRDDRLLALREKSGRDWTKDHTPVPCLIAKGRRCPMFEAVLTKLAEQASPADKPNLQKKRVAAVRTYCVEHDLETPGENRECPDCGQPLAPRQRYCETCKKRRQREAERRSRRKRAE